MKRKLRGADRHPEARSRVGVGGGQGFLTPAGVTAPPAAASRGAGDMSVAPLADRVHLHGLSILNLSKRTVGLYWKDGSKSSSNDEKEGDRTK